MSEYDRDFESNTKRSSAVESMEKIFQISNATTRQPKKLRRLIVDHVVTGSDGIVRSFPLSIAVGTRSTPQS